MFEDPDQAQRVQREGETLEERGRRFLHLARERFQFLEAEYGFEFRGFRDDGVRGEARLLYRAANDTVVRVVKHHEYSEEIWVEVGHDRNRVDAEDLAKGLGASRRRLVVEGGRARAGSFADALEYNPDLLREYGDALLRGDAAPLDEARRESEQGYELAKRIYAALARRGLEDDAGGRLLDGRGRGVGRPGEADGGDWRAALA